MKKILVPGGLVALLAACTTVSVPVPVTLGPFLPNLLPQSPPMVVPTSYTVTPEAAPVPLPDPAVIPAVAPNPSGNQPPLVLPGVVEPAPVAIPLPPQTSQNLDGVAERIFRNEMGSDDKRLISWNSQGNFVALGLGIWSGIRPTSAALC
ncbi:MAG: hypothetical protein R3E89_17315 [Thiolinea sp.]